VSGAGTVEGMLGFGLIVLLVHRARGVVTRPRVRRWLERVAGVVFIGFGVRLAADRL